MYKYKLKLYTNLKYQQSATMFRYIELIHPLKTFGGQYIRRHYTNLSNQQASEDSIRNAVDEWMPLIKRYLTDALKDKEKQKEIGNLLSGPVEMYINDMIQQKTNKKVSKIVGKAYDGITEDGIKHQTKFRMGTWNMRKYHINDFDVLYIFCPDKNFSLKKSSIKCIPSHDLKSKKDSQYLIQNMDSLKKVDVKQDKYNINNMLEKIYK